METKQSKSTHFSHKQETRSKYTMKQAVVRGGASWQLQQWSRGLMEQAAAVVKVHRSAHHGLAMDWLRTVASVSQ